MGVLLYLQEMVHSSDDSGGFTSSPPDSSDDNSGSYRSTPYGSKHTGDCAHVKSCHHAKYANSHANMFCLIELKLPFLSGSSESYEA